jgi:hypothetical protein
MQSPTRRFQHELQHSPSIRATLVQPGLPNRPCVVSDISDGGARIVVEGNDPIPMRFELALVSGTRCVCEPIWSHGRTAGLRFVH